MWTDQTSTHQPGAGLPGPVELQGAALIARTGESEHVVQIETQDVFRPDETIAAPVPEMHYTLDRA